MITTLSLMKFVAERLQMRCVINFLNDRKFCVLNGRFGDQSSISTRGKAVVDYASVPVDFLEQCLDFKTYNCNDMMDSFNLTEHIGTRSNPPDHAFLLFDYQFKPSSHYTDHQQYAQEAIISSNQTPKKRFKVRNIPADFMSSDLVKQTISEVIRTIE